MGYGIELYFLSKLQPCHTLNNFSLTLRDDQQVRYLEKKEKNHSNHNLLRLHVTS